MGTPFTSLPGPGFGIGSGLCGSGCGAGVAGRDGAAGFGTSAISRPHHCAAHRHRALASSAATVYRLEFQAHHLIGSVAARVTQERWPVVGRAQKVISASRAFRPSASNLLSDRSRSRLRHPRRIGEFALPDSVALGGLGHRRRRWPLGRGLRLRLVGHESGDDSTTNYWWQDPCRRLSAARYRRSRLAVTRLVQSSGRVNVRRQVNEPNANRMADPKVRQLGALAKAVDGRGAHFEQLRDLAD